MVAFWKLLDHSYVQSSFSLIMRHVENSTLKDTLQVNNLRIWINIRDKSLIKTSVNIMKQKSMQVPGKISVAQKSKRSLWRTLDTNIIRFTYFIHLLFLSSFFKFNIVLIGIFLDTFHHSYLPFCLLINIWYFTDLKVYPCFYTFL